MTRVPGILFGLLAMLRAASPSLADETCRSADRPQSVGSGNRPQYVGAGACSANNCHGSVTRREERSIWQNEYFTWFKKDKHAGAFTVLRQESALRMARRLGMVDASADAADWLEHAANPERCLDCHSVNVADDERDPRFDPKDGVSCEACHGPAGGWIEQHSHPDWTYAQSIERGMSDTRDLACATGVCLSCHLGTKSKQVDHALIAAGHPVLQFELAVFANVLMPRHWTLHDDNRQWARAGPWAMGQAVSLRESARYLARANRAGAWPDFALYDCYACHHDLGRQNWRKDRPASPPGRPLWDTARFSLVPYLLRSLDDGTTEEMRGQVWKLARLARDGQSGASLAAAAETVAVAADRLIDRLRQQPLDPTQIDHVLNGIGADSNQLSYSGFRTAQQVAWGLAALTTARTGPESPDSQAMQATFDPLFDQLTDPRAYDPARFVREVSAVRAKVAPPHGAAADARSAR